MRNKYIKFMDKHKIDDGVLRELLHHSNLVAAHDQSLSTCKKYKAKLGAMDELMEMIQSDMEE